jgi:hypothetical protein
MIMAEQAGSAWVEQRDYSKVCSTGVVMTSTISPQDVKPYGEFLTDDHHAVREMVQDLAAREIAPKAAEVDRNARFPEETFKILGKSDLLGLPIPSEYGGAGADYRSYAIAVEEIGRACGSTGLSYAAHVSLGTNPIYLFGTEEQKQKYLPKLCSGVQMPPRRKRRQNWKAIIGFSMAPSSSSPTPLTLIQRSLWR